MTARDRAPWAMLTLAVAAAAITAAGAARDARKTRDDVRRLMDRAQELGVVPEPEPIRMDWTRIDKHIQNLVPQDGGPQ